MPLYITDRFRPEQMLGADVQKSCSLRSISEEEMKKLTNGEEIYSRISTQKISSLMSGKFGQILEVNNTPKQYTPRVPILYVYYEGPVLEADGQGVWPVEVPEGGRLSYYLVEEK